MTPHETFNRFVGALAYRPDADLGEVLFLAGHLSLDRQTVEAMLLAPGRGTKAVRGKARNRVIAWHDQTIRLNDQVIRSFGIRVD